MKRFLTYNSARQGEMFSELERHEGQITLTFIIHKEIPNSWYKHGIGIYEHKFPIEAQTQERIMKGMFIDVIICECYIYNKCSKLHQPKCSTSSHMFVCRCIVDGAFYEQIQRYQVFPSHVQQQRIFQLRNTLGMALTCIQRGPQPKKKKKIIQVTAHNTADMGRHLIMLKPELLVNGDGNILKLFWQILFLKNKITTTSFGVPDQSLSHADFNIY